MGFRFRKSVKIAPGIKLNFGKKSTGVSLGGKLGGISINSKNGAHSRVSIPGTGISYTKPLGSSSEHTKRPEIDRTDIPEGNYQPPLDMRSRGASYGSGKGPGPGIALKILRAVLSVLFLLGGIGFMPSAGGALLILFAVACAPIGPVDRFLADQFHLRGKLKAGVLAALCVAGIVAAPTAKPETLYSQITAGTAPAYQETAEAASESHADAQAGAGSATKSASAAAAAKPEAAQEAAAGTGAAKSEASAPAPSKASGAAAAATAGAAAAAAAQPAAKPAEKQTPAQAPADTNEETVYVTETGSKYHLNPHCGNGTYTATTLERAKAMGLTPCKKCAGG